MVSLFWFQGGKTKIGRTGSAGALAHLDGTLWDQGKAWPGNPHGLTKLEWSRTFGPSFFLNVKGSLYNTGFSLAPQGGLEDDRWITDNVDAEARGTAYGQFYERPQKTVTADSSYFVSGLGGSHELRFGGGLPPSGQQVDPDQPRAASSTGASTPPRPGCASGATAPPRPRPTTGAATCPTRSRGTA